MSIVTLKRKTQAKYNNMSVGQKQFSLNGTHRNQGYVGQTTLSRSLPTTLMKGNVIRGHGGCCGHYPIKPIVQSGVNYQEDSSVVKHSVLNTAGMIETKYQCIGECSLGTNVCEGSSKRINHVKPDNNNNTNSQQDYISSVANKAVVGCNTVKDVQTGQIQKIHLGYNTITTCSVTKTDQEIGIPKSAGEYTDYLVKVNCSTYNKLSYNSKPSMGKTFGC